MATFSERSISTEGRKLLVDVLISGGSKSIEFTSLVIGDGAAPADLSSMTGLINPLFDIEVAQVETSQEGIATIRGSFKNTEDGDPFYWRELGVFARLAGTNDAPILFAYANAGNSASLIGRVEEGSVMEQSIVMSVVVGNADVVIIDNPLAAATAADIADTRRQLNKALNDHANDTNKHVSDAERTRWDDTPTKKNLSDHEGDKVLHTTADERKKWNAVVAAVPPGVIFASACTSMEGYLLCNGAAVSRTKYTALFAAISTKFGAGDGTNTFNLPDMRGRFPQGANGNLGASIAAGLPNIYGEFSAIDLRNHHTGAFKDGGQPGERGHYGGSGVYAYRTHLFSASYYNDIYGKSTTVQPPAVALNYFIKC